MIKIDKLSKKYDKDYVLKDLSCTIKDNSIYGLVGANGSGKSTLLRTIMGIYEADGGVISVDGEEVYDNEIMKQKMVFVQDDLFFYPGYTLMDTAKWYEAMYKDFDMNYLKELAGLLNLKLDKKISTFSKGMKRQCALICAISTNCDYMFFDETFDGLDPVIRNTMKKILIKQMNKKRTTIVMTSHNLRELEDICDNLGLLYQGGILFESDIDTIKTNMFKVQISFENLTSLFNFNYLKENIKKSKAIILLCMLLLPILNGIILLMHGSTGDNFVASIYDVSGIILFGMYIIPLVLSITLFSFIYKKGAVDFTLSMPINKRQIFLTNTIGGMAIILIMQIINFIVMLLVSLIYSNIIVSYKMLFDILLMYSISYIFVFVCTNIAASVSSNKITTIVVTLLIMFLIPFISTFINSNAFTYYGNSDVKVECVNDSCKPKNYYCDTVKCEIDKKNNIYTANIRKYDNVTYTLPYELIKDNLFGIESDNRVNTSIIKMIILSIIYIIVGTVLFSNKRFEIVGTSFRSEKIHILVRTLTTIPIVCLAYVVLKNSSISSYDIFSIVLLFVLIFTYLIIYDLITRKKVTNFFKMAICLAIVGGVTIVVGALVDVDSYSIKAKDVKEISFLDDNGNVIGSTKNTEVINNSISLLLDTESLENYTYNYTIKTNVKGSTYRFNIYTTKDNYNYINNILINDKEFSKDFNKYKNNDIFGIKYKDGYNRTNDSNLSDMIVNKYKNDKNIFMNNNSDNDLFNVTLYVYNGFNVKEIDFDVSGDKNLEVGLLRYYNANTKKMFSKINSDNDIYNYYIDDTYCIYNFEYYNEISKFIIDNIDDNFDINKDYGYISTYTHNGKNVFVTNKVDELNLLKSKYASLDTDVVIDGE